MMSLNQENTTPARAYPGSDAQRIRPISVARQGLPRGERTRLKTLAPANIRVGTLNVGTMTGRGMEVVELMKMRRISVLCVQETRWRGNKAKELAEGYKLYYSGADHEGRNGVGVILSPEMKENILNVTRIDDRIMEMKIMYGSYALNFVSAYAPQTGLAEEEKDLFWRKLDTLMERLPVEERVIIGADLNGHVGKENYGVERIHGGHGYGRKNGDGERALDLAVSFDLMIANTFFTKRDEHAITYKSGGRKSQIDYLLYRRPHIKEITDCKVIPGDHVAPQHRLLVLNLQLNTIKPRKRIYEKKIKWSLLKEEEKQQEFKTKVLERMNDDVHQVDTWWRTNAEILRNTGKEVLGETSGNPRRGREEWWWKQDIQETLTAKKEAKKRWEQTRSQLDKEEYMRRKKVAKKEVAIAKAEACENLYEELETPQGQKKIYWLAKSRNKATKDIQHVKQMKDASGNILTKDEDVCKRWKEYYETLLNEENHREFFEEGTPHMGLTRQVERVEVEKAIKKMKNNKAVGPDNIPVEAWKALGREGIDILWSFMKMIEEQEVIPDEWRYSVMVPIFKEKGDVQDCTNYRGIKLLSHTMKVWERIVDARLRQEVEISESQYGFMPQKGTTNAIFMLRQVMEKYREKQREIHTIFIDLEKAYDRIPRQEVWRCLREKGVPEKYVRLINEMYRCVRTKVRTVAGMSEHFDVKVGLHQGSALSPFLFNVVFDVLTKGVRRGAPWDIMYADDVVLVGESKEEVEERLEQWRIVLESRGMRISRSKTQYMSMADWDPDQDQFQGGNRGVRNVNLDGQTLTSVDNFKYLGSTVASDGNEDKEIAKRIQAGWKNWRDMSGILCDKKMPIKLKGKVHKTVVRPAMAYGLETTQMKRTSEKKMDVAEMKMLRWMSGVTMKDKIKNDVIRGTVKVASVSKKVQESRLRWFGHVMRRDEESSERQTMEMEVDGRRKRGKPKTRWKDCIVADGKEKNLDLTLVENRTTWRRLIKNSDPM